MIYSIFIYNSSSGLLMWDKTFEDISHGKAEMFSSFFSAIKSFVQEMVLKGENTLKTIEMGNYILKITNIKVKNKKSAIDLVLIADKDDEKKLKKVVPGITKVILDRSALFEDWIGGERKIFNVMDQPIVEAISKVKGLLTSGKSILDDQSEVLHSIWNKKKDEKVIDPEIIGNLNKEREFLFSKINDTTKIVKKIELINNVIVIDQKLRDETRFIEDQNLKIKFDKEFSDIKMKLNYFLQQTKSSLSATVEKAGRSPLETLDFRDAYIALYSFGGKLKLAGKEEKAEHYRNMARVLMDKKESSELSETISSILKMGDDINSYLI